MQPPITKDESDQAMMLLGVNANADQVASTVRQIRIVKPQQSVIIPSRKEVAMKRLNDIETELGRMTRLLTELRADILSLTIE